MRACGVNPADWKIREGELGGELPQGMGIEIAGASPTGLAQCHEIKR